VSDLENVTTSGPVAVSLLETVLKAMEFDAKPELVSETDEEIQIEISGESDDIGRLIGRHGQTLDALQYLVGIAVNKDRYEKMRVLLDAEGYRERHKQTLEARVIDLAEKVKAAGQEAVLEPQSARDRRIVHMVLADDSNISTYSEGEGEYRHIVISPRKM
jgi:spoIIIJ-associated protein